MSSPPITLAPETSVMDAIALLVKHRISGAPVVDADNRVLGMCSAYDLLALDSTPGKLDKSFFPPVNTCIEEFGGDRKLMWSNFKLLRQKLVKANGSIVREIMHPAHKIRVEASMEDAANRVVQKRAHRICVIDDQGTVIGIVSRGDILRATMSNFKEVLDVSLDEGDGNESLNLPEVRR